MLMFFSSLFIIRGRLHKQVKQMNEERKAEKSCDELRGLCPSALCRPLSSIHALASPALSVFPVVFPIAGLSWPVAPLFAAAAFV